MRVPSDKLSFTIAEASEMTGIGKTKMYQLLGSGELPARKIGNRTLILRDDLEKFLRKLDKYENERDTC